MDALIMLLIAIAIGLMTVAASWGRRHINVLALPRWKRRRMGLRLSYASVLRRGLVPAGGDGTETMETLGRGIAEVRTFIEQRYDPLSQNVELMRQEQERLAGQVHDLLETQRQANRAALMRRGGNDRLRVTGGPYDGMDRLDLVLMRSLAAGIFSDHRADAQTIERAKRWMERIDEYKRAMDPTTSGAGDELVPTSEASELWRDVHLMTSVASLFRTFPMPTNPFDLPLDFGDMNWYPGTPNVATTSTDPTTAKRTLTAYKLAAALAWAYELDEDAVIAVMPELRALLVRNGAEVLDDVILNADTTTTNNINADGATISASDAGKAQWLLGFDGLLHIPLVDNTGQANDHNAAVSDDMFNEIRGKLGKYGVRPADLAWITDINTYIRALSIDSFRTLDKLGPQATLLTGQLGVVEGVPVIVSEQMRLADADGKVTDAGNSVDTGRLLIVNRTQYTKGFRRELLIESERDIQKQQTIMVTSMRVAFDGRNVNGSDTAIALQYDITGVA